MGFVLPCFLWGQRVVREVWQGPLLSRVRSAALLHRDASEPASHGGRSCAHSEDERAEVVLGEWGNQMYSGWTSVPRTDQGPPTAGLLPLCCWEFQEPPT